MSEILQGHGPKADRYVTRVERLSLDEGGVRTLAGRYRRAGSFPTRYWTPEVHAAAFALPRFIAEIVAKAKPQRRSVRRRQCRCVD